MFALIKFNVDKVGVPCEVGIYKPYKSGLSKEIAEEGKWYGRDLILLPQFALDALGTEIPNTWFVEGYIIVFFRIYFIVNEL